MMDKPLTEDKIVGWTAPIGRVNYVRYVRGVDVEDVVSALRLLRTKRKGGIMPMVKWSDILAAFPAFKEALK